MSLSCNSARDRTRKTVSVNDRNTLDAPCTPHIAYTRPVSNNRPLPARISRQYYGRLEQRFWYGWGLRSLNSCVSSVQGSASQSAREMDREMWGVRGCLRLRTTLQPGTGVIGVLAMAPVSVLHSWRRWLVSDDGDEACGLYDVEEDAEKMS